MSLTENLTVGEMKALEELVRLLVASKDISRDVVQQLWKTFASRVRQIECIAFTSMYLCNRPSPLCDDEERLFYWEWLRGNQKGII